MNLVWTETLRAQTREATGDKGLLLGNVRRRSRMETIIKTGEPRPERDFLASATKRCRIRHKQRFGDGSDALFSGGEIDATQKATPRQAPGPSNGLGR